ncbi:MAG: YdcF family protein [Proteobacteria bacterium]|nr:YdcF family protein [Pseudomonadota bacterium]MBU1741115.1 YdcF family protein [Pseudomonadota bacterium]
MSFALKKLIGGLATNPFVYIGVTLLGGWLLGRFSRFKKTGRGLVVTGLILAYVVFFGPWGQLAVSGLEGPYRPLVIGPSHRGVRWIVVLSGGLYADPRGPGPWGRLRETSLRRTLEGARLARALPGAKLVLTGGVIRGKLTEAELMARVALRLGIDRQRIVKDQKPWDTAGQARTIAALVKADPVILVTSANHLPRATALFRRAGVKVIAAPTDYRVGRARVSIWSFIIPQPAAVVLWRIALHEYLGLVWAWIRGQV